MIDTAKNKIKAVIKDLTTEQIAAIYKAAGDILRLQMLRIMRRNSFGVLELSYLFDISQPATSHHLKVLSQVNLITMRREGSSIYYRRPHGQQDVGIRRSIFESIDKNPINPLLRSRLEVIYNNRAKCSQNFFHANVERFKQQQDLIASYNDYGDAIAQFIRSLDIVKGSCLEVGVGEGELLSDLTKIFRRIVAIDNNISVLKIAKIYAQQQQLKKVNFKLAEANDLIELKTRFNCITCNMVLHHNPLPSRMIEDFSRLIKPHGSLIITDLCQHDQDWARQNCGDLWLGFNPDDITEWCNNAGLQEGECEFLSLRNGFQIQIRQFRKLSTIETT